MLKLFGTNVSNMWSTVCRLGFITYKTILLTFLDSTDTHLNHKHTGLYPPKKCELIRCKCRKYLEHNLLTRIEDRILISRIRPELQQGIIRIKLYKFQTPFHAADKPALISMVSGFHFAGMKRKFPTKSVYFE